MCGATIGETDEALFSKRWTEEFANQAKLFKNRGRDVSDWEGLSAYRELKIKNNLWFVIPDEDFRDWPAPFLMRRLVREISAYKRCEDIVAINKCFKDGIESLSRARNLILKQKGNAEKAPVKEIVDDALDRVTATIADERSWLEQRAVDSIKEDLLAAPEERKSWPPDIEDMKRGLRHIRAKPPDDLLKWEKLFNDYSYPRVLTRRIDLDSRLQVRLAVILRHYLYLSAGVSLVTIARLTVLAYKCADLVEDHDGHLRIKSTKKILTVSAVDQKLRQARLK